MDSVVSLLERMCEGAPSQNFSLLVVNWSPSNIPSGGDKTKGEIGTSHYTREGGVSNLYVLGRENVDTDEYDDHVIAHEFGHYAEDRIYRADSIGGPHSADDILDPRVAFGEGYGNAFSGMVFRDPVYVDTGGTRQSRGFSMNVDNAPSGNDRGVYSETSVMHVLWKLYENRDATPLSGSYERIHGVLVNHHRVTSALTTLQSFAAFYNANHGGNSDDLRSLWSTTLDQPYDALCAGTCAGTGDVADPFDVDNDLGKRYSASRNYYGTSGLSAEFWRLYQPLSNSGFSAPGTAHEQVLGIEEGSNKFGTQRWYTYTGTGAEKRFAISNPGGASCPASDDLDVDVYDTTGMQAEGRLQSGTQALVLEPKGGVRMQKPGNPLGEVSTDAEGNPIIRMKSEPR